MAFGSKKIERFEPLVRINIGIDKCFSVQEKINIIEALINWQEATRGLVVFHIQNMSISRLIMDKDDSYTWYSMNIVRALENDDVILKFEEGRSKINGLATFHKNTTIAFIVADRIKYDDEFVSLVMHEIGHLLGLDHSPKGNIMYKYRNRSPIVTDCDINQLINIWVKTFKLAAC